MDKNFSLFKNKDRSLESLLDMIAYVSENNDKKNIDFNLLSIVKSQVFFYLQLHLFEAILLCLF
jgi:hypothetical protein